YFPAGILVNSSGLSIQHHSSIARAVEIGTRKHGHNSAFVTGWLLAYELVVPPNCFICVRIKITSDAVLAILVCGLVIMSRAAQAVARLNDSDFNLLSVDLASPHACNHL